MFTTRGVAKARYNPLIGEQMSETYLRQWSMLRHIPRYPNKKTAADLLGILQNLGFEASKRTIERDLVMLSRVFPLTCDERSKPYGWSWTEKGLFDIPSMEVSVALAFALAKKFLQPLIPRSSYKHLAPYFNHAEKVLSNTEKSGQKKWLGKVKIIHRGQKLLSSDVPSHILDVVYEALLVNKKLDIHYRAIDSEVIKRFEVNPLGLVFRDATIYLVGCFWDYDDIRQLVLHRIVESSIIEKTKRAPKNFTLEGYVNTGEFGLKQSDENINLKVIFAREAGYHVRETKLSKEQIVSSDHDGNIIIQAIVLDTLELRWWLRGFGDQVEVLGPQELRQEFAMASKKVHEIYHHKSNNNILDER